MKRFAFRKSKQKIKNISEVQASVIKDFVFDTNFQVKFLSGTSAYIKELPLLFEDSEITIIDLAQDFSPLTPFFKILSGFKVSDSILDDFCYFPQKKAFRSYLKNGIADKRFDVFVSDNIGFEKRTMRQTLISMMEEIVSGDFLILNTQCIGEEAFEILKDLEKSDIRCSITFCIDSFDEDNTTGSLHNYFLEKQNDLNFLNICDESDRSLFLDHPKSKYDREFSFSQVMDIFENNRVFLAVSENRRFADSLVKKSGTYNFFPEQLRIIYKEIGLAYFYNNDLDEAVLYFNNVIESSRNDALAAEIYLFLSKIFHQKRNLKQALKYALLVEQIAKEEELNVLYPLGLMMEYFCCENYDDPSYIELYKKALKALKEAGLTINYIYTCNQIPVFLYETREYFGFILEQLEGAYSLANQIGDIPEIASSSHWKAMILSKMGETEQSTILFNESNRLRTQMGELPPLLTIRNGLSYEALCRADYYEAYSLINSIISRIYEITEYPMIVSTITNCTFSLFYSRHYELCYSLFNQILRFLQLMGLSNEKTSTFMPSSADIMLYKTIIEFDNGDFIHARNNCSSLAKKHTEISPMEQPFYNFLQSIVFVTEGNVPLSEEAFEEAVNAYTSKFIGQEHRVVFMHYEYALVLKKLGFVEKATEYMKKGFILAQEKHFTYYTKNKTSMTIDEYISDIKDFEPLNLNMEYLEEKIEKESLMNQLHNRIYEYQFLNKIMGFGSENSNLEKYLGRVVQTLMDYLMAEDIYISERTETGWKLLAASNGNDGEEIVNGRWEELYQKSCEEKQMHLTFDPVFHQYYRNLSKFDFVGGMIIIPGRHTQMSMEMINVLNLAISNIQAQIVMIKQEEHLVYLSSTDLLTLLKNRRALQEHIANESEKLHRYTPRRKFMIVETIAFIDLDNFKYYNDTFGHEAGDFLIASFGRLLKRVCRTVDFVSRFGGDEFVVVMTDTSSEDAKIMHQRLWKALEDAEYFIPDLEEMLGGSLNIPSSKYLGFSMGLCSNQDIDKKDDLATVMMNADHALYYVKNHRKGGVALWKDVKRSEKENPDF